MDVQKTIEEINASINSVIDPSAKIIISQLLNIIEALMQENKVLKAENQRLLDENNKLKGGNGKPNIRSQSKQNRIFSKFKGNPLIRQFPNCIKRQFVNVPSTRRLIMVNLAL
jgi:hypothetical protein